MKVRTPSLRQQKKRRTRELLIRHGMDLFLLQGFEKTTVDQIVAAAKVSQRTFFRYFPVKEAIVFAEHATHMDMLEELLSGRRGDERPVLAILDCLVELARDYELRRVEQYREWRIVVNSPTLVARDVELDFEYEDRIGGYLTENTEWAPEMCRVFAGAMFGAVRAIMREWYEGACQQDLVALGRQRLAPLFRNSGFMNPSD
jgi:AcrR family transcriptional regulator